MQSRGPTYCSEPYGWRAFDECSREAIGKAIASATWGVPRDKPEAWIDHPTTDIVIGKAAPVVRSAGGLPIIRDNIIEGACGVSGASNDSLDDPRWTRCTVARQCCRRVILG